MYLFCQLPAEGEYAVLHLTHFVFFISRENMPAGSASSLLRPQGVDDESSTVARRMSRAYLPWYEPPQAL